MYQQSFAGLILWCDPQKIFSLTRNIHVWHHENHYCVCLHIEGTKKEVTNPKKEDIDRFGPAKWDKYADFGDEFDGGDGQMGVAGDGKKGLEKFGSDVSPSFAKSKTMSAKNAWGTSTGYASNLIEKGVEVVRAQQMQNWMNQQELRRKKNAHRELTESFDSVSTEEDWRALAKFGVQRNQVWSLKIDLELFNF